MRKQLKKIICMLSAFVFAFCPLLFSGCDVSNVDSSGTTPQPTYNVTDYLSAMKVAYTPALNSSPDDSVNSYANEVVGLTELLAVDTLVNLMENYYKQNSSKNLSHESSNVETDKVKINFESSNEVALSENATVLFNDDEFSSRIQITIDDGNGNSHDEYVSFKQSIIGTSSHSVDDKKHRWKVYNSDFFNGSPSIKNIKNYLVSNSQSKATLEDNSVACQMMYAILKISNSFYNVSATGTAFDNAYSKFKTEYENSIENNKATIEECKQLALTAKHSGLIAGENGQQSSEQKAFKQYILDYIIGTTNVDYDNNMVRTYNSKTKSYEKNGDKFDGEYYYYDTNMVNVLDQINAVIDEDNEFVPENLQTPRLTYIDLIKILSTNTIPENLTNLLNGILDVTKTAKLWQDFDNNGEIDIVYHDNEQKIPKYLIEGDVEFRNYDWTVEQIVNNVLSKSVIYYNSEYITGYPTVSNVFSRDYEYSAMEISSSDLNAKYTCSLPRNAYKSILICAKDRSDKDIKNNIGFINMVLESAEGVNVDVKIFARYYRSGYGYATWSNSKELGGTLYPLVSSTLKINGPFKTELVNGEIQDSSLEINVQDMFKSAKFNGVNNSKKFDFTYTDANQQTQTKQIYEIEPFVEGYYNTSLNKAVHASVFGLNGKTNPTYNSFTLSTGEVIYSYDSENLAGESSEYGFIEILFAPSNENAFTFGLLGYIPENEFSL